MSLNFDDTIVAPATKITKQAISVIRISGAEAFLIANKMLKKKLVYKNAQQLRRIYDQKQLVDEALFITFQENQSFTGEMVVEINCHGGIVVTNKIIEIILKNGARMAKNGEFSQRAFMNGKIGLLEAEGINNLIESRNQLAARINAMNATGTSSQAILQIKELLIDVISRIQTAIDYPEYDDIQGLSNNDLIKTLTEIEKVTKKTVETSQRVFKVNDGINTLILGEPNVGKSSLLNALLNEEKAIVTNIEGTTRDVVEGRLDFHSFSLNLLDTAGIRKTTNPIEQIGIKKSLKLLESADLILFVNDSLKISQEIFEKIKNKKHILVFNKIDLLKESEKIKIKNKFKESVFINALEADVENLITKINEMWNTEELISEDQIILTSLENINSFKNLNKKINETIQNLKMELGIDMVMIDLYECLNIINTTLGIINTDEEVINNIFKKYCLGK